MTEEEMRRRFALAHLQHLAQGGPVDYSSPDYERLLASNIGDNNGLDPAKFLLPHAQTYQNAGTQGINSAIGVQNQQGQLGRMLMDQLNGGGPNLAQRELQNATDANIRQTMALNASSPSYAGVGAGNRNALTAAANIQQQAAGQAGGLRAQQALATQGQLGNLYAQQGQGAQGLAGLGLNASEAQLQAWAEQQRIQAGQEEASANRGFSMLGGGLGGLGSAVSMFAGGGGGGGGASMGSGGAGSGSVYAAHGGEIPSLSMLSGGGVPGHATVAGDSGRNDTVPAMLSPGEVVLPRSVSEDEDAPHKAMMFVQAILAKKRARMS